MRVNRFAVGALTSVLLAGCAGAGSPLAARVAGVHQSVSRHALPYHDVLYVSDFNDNVVGIYPLNANNPNPIGEIGIGILNPTGMAVDAAHRLYVADNTNNVSIGGIKHPPEYVMVFSPGSSSPGSTYWQDLRNPTDVAVGRDGTVYVAGFGDGYVTEYPAGNSTPSQHFLPPSGSAFAVALDAQNNLYVACTTANAIFEFAPGSTQGTDLGLILGGEPHGMTFDNNGNLLVAISLAPNSGSVVDVFPPGQKNPSKQIGGVFQPIMLDFDRSKRHLYVADYGSGNHDGGVFEFAYPSGTLEEKYTQGAASGAYGVAVNPAVH